MCKKLIYLFFMLAPLCLQAQEASSEENTNNIPQQARFGYLSYGEVIRLMPEYLSSQEKLNSLQQKYEAELARADKEFNIKFSEFLEGQKEFPNNIIVKRQKELQDLMEKSIAFKNEMKALLEKARKELSTPVTQKLNEAISQIGQTYKLDYILNTDNNACPYINKEVGLDVTSLVKAQLGIQ